MNDVGDVRLVDPHPSPFAKSLPCAFPRELLNCFLY